MQLHETVGTTQISMVGAGAFTPANHAGSMSMQMTLPGARVLRWATSSTSTLCSRAAAST